MSESKVIETWLTEWATSQGCTFESRGEVGFGRTCAGIKYESSYVDYSWQDGIWEPDDAYPKHECLAVLVYGEDYDKAINQLYQWVIWLRDNNFRITYRPRVTYNSDALGRAVELFMGGKTQAILVKQDV